MQISHLFSDLFLFAASIYVFFRHIKPMPITQMILWESFVLSVAASALFGAIAYAGIEVARPISDVFKQLASITGAIGLVAGVYSLVTNKQFSQLQTMGILGLAFFALLAQVGLHYEAVEQWAPILAMASIFVLGIWAFVKGKSSVGMWLILSVAFFASAQYSFEMFGSHSNTIDLFHFFTAAGILSLGIAVSRS